MDRINEAQLLPERRAKLHGFTSAIKGRPALSASLAVVILAAGGYFGWHSWKGAAPEAAQYTTATVQRADLEDTVTATGILQPRDYVDVGTQVSGQVKKLAVAIGDTVKAGQLLAEIDSTVYKTKVDADTAQLRTQEAQLTDRQAQLELAQQQFQRQTNMMKENATTQSEVDTAAATLHSATAQIDVLKAQTDQTRSTLRGDEANLNYTKIYAPMAGTVVSQAAKQGQTLNANQQAPIVMRIADLSTMTVQSQVSEADVSKLHLGMDVYFTTLGNQTKRWYGKLRQIEPTPQTVNNVVLYNALFDVTNPDQALMTQMTAQVFFVTAQAKNALQVPVTALQRVRGTPDKANATTRRANADKGTPRAASADNSDMRSRFTGGNAIVKVVKSDGTLEDRNVTVGVVTRIAAEIRSGLQEGETIVTGSAVPATKSATAKPAANAPRLQPRI